MLFYKLRLSLSLLFTAAIPPQPLGKNGGICHFCYGIPVSLSVRYLTPSPAMLTNMIYMLFMCCRFVSDALSLYGSSSGDEGSSSSGSSSDESRLAGGLLLQALLKAAPDTFAQYAAQVGACYHGLWLHTKDTPYIVPGRCFCNGLKCYGNICCGKV